MAYTEFFVTHGSAVSDTNGGGPRLGTNDGPVYATAGATVDAGDPNVIHDNSGSSWSGCQADDWVCWDTAGAKEFRRIVSISGTDATVSASCTPGANKAVNVGGAWATIDFAAGLITTSHVNAAGNPPRVNVKAGSAYTESSVTITHSGTAAIPLTWEGYTTSAGDGGVFQQTSTSNSTYAFRMADWCVLKDAYITSSGTSCRAVSVDNYGSYYCCINVSAKATGSNSHAFIAGNDAYNTLFVNCYVEQATLDGFGANRTGLYCIDCRVKSVGRYGFYPGYSLPVLVNCIVDSSANDCVYIGGNVGAVIVGCTFYHSTGGSGIRHVDPGSFPAHVRNCIFSQNNQYGIELDSAADHHEDYNAFYANGVAARKNVVQTGPHDVTLTADPFVNAAGGNYALNTAVGGGAACRAAGFPGAMLDAVNIGYLDIGALQHADPAAGAGGVSKSRIIGGV